MGASFSLIIEDDAGKQIVVPFAKDVITIGRKEGNTIRLTERNVSRFHAKLERQPTGILVEDLSSFNGIKLNGDRIAGKVLVSAGDVIEIGDYHLELRASSTQPAPQKNLGPVGSRSGSLPDASATADDDFEGDTQRWEPPPPASATPPTQEDTMPMLAASSPSPFADGNGDTERLDLQHLRNIASQGGQNVPAPPAMSEPQAWPPPTPRAPPAPAAPPALELEATARQPISQVPIGGTAPSSQPLVQPLSAAPTAPMPAAAAAPPASAAAMPHETTMDMPLPAARALAPPPAPAAPVASAPPRRRGAEETEQLRAAPAGPASADDLTLPRLVALNTIFAGSAFALRAVENVIGRTDDNDIVVEHRSVSRNHAKLVREGDRVRILDLKSANGVLVNGEEVEQHVLKSGDIIELGRLRLRFVAVGERFVVPADEIERARIADAAGEDFDSNGATVNVANPMRALGASPPAAKTPAVIYGALVVLAIIVIVLLVLVIQGRSGGEPTPTAVGSLPAEAVPPPPPPEPTPPPPAPAPTPSTETPPPPTPPIEEPAPAPDANDDEDKKPSSTSSPKKVSAEDLRDWTDRGKKALVQGNFNQAIDLLKKVEKATPNDPSVHRTLGIAYAKLHRNAEAKKHYARYAELAPDAPDAADARRFAQ